MDSSGQTIQFSGKENWWTDKDIKSSTVFTSVQCTADIVGKPKFFNLRQRFKDRRDKVLFEGDIPRAANVHPNKPHKIIPIYGPSRLAHEVHLPWQYGTYWGPNDWSNGRAWKDLSREDRRRPPPAYTDAISPSPTRCRCCGGRP
jgi:hypothetical protein